MHDDMGIVIALAPLAFGVVALLVIGAVLLYLRLRRVLPETRTAPSYVDLTVGVAVAFDALDDIEAA